MTDINNSDSDKPESAKNTEIIHDKITKRQFRQEFCNIVSFQENKIPLIPKGFKVLRELQSDEEFEELLYTKRWGITQTILSSIILFDLDSKNCDNKFDKILNRSRRSFKRGEFINSRHGIVKVTNADHNWCVEFVKIYHDAGNLEMFAENQNMIFAGAYHSKKESDLDDGEKMSLSTWRDKDDTVTSPIIEMTKEELGVLFSGKARTKTTHHIIPAGEKKRHEGLISLGFGKYDELEQSGKPVN